MIGIVCRATAAAGYCCEHDRNRVPPPGGAAAARATAPRKPTPRNPAPRRQRSGHHGRGGARETREEPPAQRENLAGGWRRGEEEGAGGGWDDAPWQVTTTRREKRRAKRRRAEGWTPGGLPPSCQGPQGRKKGLGGRSSARSEGRRPGGNWAGGASEGHGGVAGGMWKDHHNYFCCLPSLKIHAARAHKDNKNI